MCDLASRDVNESPDNPAVGNRSHGDNGAVGRAQEKGNLALTYSAGWQRGFFLRFNEGNGFAPRPCRF
jgi:hypothetical protein